MAAKKILATAILGSILGSLAIQLYPNRKRILDAIAERSNLMSSRSQEYVDELLNRGLALAHLRRERGTELSWKSALAGLLLGAGAAMLLAPRSGRETRKQVKGLYNRISGKTQKAFKDFSNGVFDGPGPKPFNGAETLYPLKKNRKQTKV